jgi:type II secretory pathway predicted ATPase ExeA
VSSECLTELRLLQSASFDSKSLLVTVLCGDTRLTDRFRTPELLPLGSRIRTRFIKWLPSGSTCYPTASDLSASKSHAVFRALSL